MFKSTWTNSLAIPLVARGSLGAHADAPGSEDAKTRHKMVEGLPKYMLAGASKISVAFNCYDLI